MSASKISSNDVVHIQILDTLILGEGLSFGVAKLLLRFTS